MAEEKPIKKIGKYEILSELGRGAMGVVWRARDPFIGRQVALKTITPGLLDNPDDADTLPQPDFANTFLESVDFFSVAGLCGGPGLCNFQGIDTTVDRLKAYVADFNSNIAFKIITDPASGGFNSSTGGPAVGTAPQGEHGVRAIPYPVLHFTLAETGGVRILADADDDFDYRDFIRVLGGVPPYTFADVGADSLGEGGTPCAGSLALTTTTGRISGTPNPAGGAPQTANCDITIRVTDSATVPQVIEGDFRLVITED